MKKVLIVLFMLFPVIAFADEKCSVIKKDTSTTLNREISCDKNNKISTEYKTTKAEKVFENEVCTITCTEDVIFLIDPVKKVLAGTSFKYPLYVSAERRCTAKYNYKTYEDKMTKLVSEYGKLTGTQKATKANEITNYYQKRKACDEFTKDGSEYENKYSLKGTVSLKLETSSVEKTINYTYKDISDYSSKVMESKTIYPSCNYNEDTKKCNSTNKSVESWTEIAKVYGKYTMPNSYVEKYTGNIYNSATSSTKYGTCNAGDRYFVDFNEYTKPEATDKEDNGYKLTLTASNIGNNIITTGDRWNLKVNCSYKVKNLSNPQGGTTVRKDENYDEYGNFAYMYRVVNLYNPFPDREPNANWVNKENILISTRDNINNMSKFVINLNNSKIRVIREYNASYPYDTFNFNGEQKSIFIENYQIVQRT